jgi:hypothetical protein
MKITPQDIDYTLKLVEEELDCRVVITKALLNKTLLDEYEGLRDLIQLFYRESDLEERKLIAQDLDYLMKLCYNNKNQENK